MKSYIQLRVNELDVIIPEDCIDCVMYSDKEKTLSLKLAHDNKAMSFKGEDAVSLYQQITKAIKLKSIDLKADVDDEKERFLPIGGSFPKNTM